MVYCKCNLKFKNNPNLKSNPNPNLNLNINLYTNINLNVGRGYPWSTASWFSPSTDIHGYPRLQLTFVCLNAAILNIWGRFLAFPGTALFGYLPSSSLGLLFTALQEFDPVTEQSFVRPNFRASHRDRLEFHEDGVFVLKPVVFCSRVGQFPQFVIGSWEVWTSGAIESRLQESAVEVALHECHAPGHAFVRPEILLMPELIRGLVFLTVTLGGFSCHTQTSLARVDGFLQIVTGRLRPY
jgi:hypothetical protein